MTRIDDVVRSVEDQLARAGIDSPGAEAAILVAHVLEVPRGRLAVLQVLGKSVDQASADTIQQLVEARATRVPLQHLTGTTSFYGLDLAMEPGVFIPRVETEVLVDTVLSHFTTNRPLNILDLCTGSGAIAAALAQQFGQRDTMTNIWAVDIDPAAVALAQHNTSQYNVTVLRADATDEASLLAAAPQLAERLGTFDAVVANPPYIPLSTPVTQPEAEHDPELALYGGSDDGLAIPLRIAEHAERWLAPDGLFIMEHDQTHASQLADTLRQIGHWKHVTTLRDLTGTDRLVSALRTPNRNQHRNSPEAWHND